MIVREYVPVVGDVVRLSSRGLLTVGGLRSPEEVEAHTKGCKVIGVESVPMTPPTWAVDLEGPLGRFLIMHTDVEPVGDGPHNYVDVEVE